MYCANCGKLLKDGAEYCPYCGKKVELIFEDDFEDPIEFEKKEETGESASFAVTEKPEPEETKENTPEENYLTENNPEENDLTENTPVENDLTENTSEKDDFTENTPVENASAENDSNENNLNDAAETAAEKDSDEPLSESNSEEISEAAGLGAEEKSDSSDNAETGEVSDSSDNAETGEASDSSENAETREASDSGNTAEKAENSENEAAAVKRNASGLSESEASLKKADSVPYFDRADDEEKSQKPEEHPKQHNKMRLALSLFVLFIGIALLLAVAVMMVRTLMNSFNEPVKEIDHKKEESVVSTVSVTTVAEGEKKVQVKLRDEDFEYSGAVEYDVGGVFKFTLPDYWNNLCDYSIEGTTITFRQNKAVEAGLDGTVFIVDEIPSVEMAAYAPCKLIRREGDMSYVVRYPSGITYDENDDYMKQEYERLQLDMSYIMQSFSLDGEDEIPEPTPEPEKPEEEASEDAAAITDGYLIPESASRYLTAEDLAGFTSDQLWVARNEIYARKGRRFDNPNLQAYFDSKGWYNGTIDPGSFSDSMLSDIEKRNAELIRSME